MQTISEPLSANSPPFILDSDMSGPMESDPDFEFLDNSHLSFEATYSTSNFFEEFTSDSPPYFSAFGTPSAANHKSPEQASFINTSVLQPTLSAPSTASPAGSSHSSSPDSITYKRKSSSDSSRSALTSAGAMIPDDVDMGDWKGDDIIKGENMSNFGEFAGNGTINPSAMDKNHGFNDKAMENDFDFESASSSPSPFAITMDMESPGMPAIKYDTPRKSSPMVKTKFRNHNKSHSQYSVALSTSAYRMSSREASPLSAATSQGSSPANMFNISPSPSAGVDFVNGAILNTGHANPPWNNGIEFPPNMTRPQNHFNQQPFPGMAQAANHHIMGVPYPKPTFTIHPTPLKSRVETQIPIKMTLFPIPLGVTKLHLPTHTISKPKLLVKPTPERSPDTLELYTMLVCTSAMQNPENRRRALERAAAPENSFKHASLEGGADEEDDGKPLNGGEVRICSGCITRERKRAARKKVKKVEEEESWHKDEAKRVIVFNTHELKDWQTPTSQPPCEATGDRPEPFVPEGAMQVDAPMRIACYCRHQNEKLGFQVIFTIKDFQDRVIAQEITSSIMITDDHKTHNMLPVPAQASGTPESSVFPGPSQFPADRNLEIASGPVPTPGMTPFRVSASNADLQNMPQTFMQYSQPMSYPPSNPSQTTSATMTPRHPSPQASPSTPSGPPMSKKRKASGSSKVPTGLAMTKLETGQSGMNTSVIMPTSATASTMPSPFTPNLANFPSNEQQFPSQSASAMPPHPQHFNTGPPTPNSNDQLFITNGNRSQSIDSIAMHQMYSAPVSAHPSRAPSPNGLRNTVQAYQQQQAHMAATVSNGLYGMPLNISQQRPPVIHKLIPNEGPKAGGIEVTCLGSGFCQGLEVMFGDAKATTTTFWGETSLVCLLPPSAIAGTVPVTFKHQHQQRPQYPAPPMPKQQAFFKYVDDDEQQIIRTALAVLGHKMTGKMEDVRDLARRIVDGPWGAPSGQSPPGGGASQHGPGFNAAAFGVDVEATLLRCLDLIDLDDSPHLPRLNLRRSSGQTMLHFACSLGLHRFVAALLARGANPEPRDKGGFTPMHFAALHNHPQIVRRLILGGADPTVRSLQGYTPADMTSSDEVRRAARHLEHHTRTRSGSSLKSRTSSATSLRSLWQPPTNSEVPEDHGVSDSDEDEGSDEYEDEDADTAAEDAFWMRQRQSRRSNMPKPLTEKVEPIKEPVMELPSIEPAVVPSPTAAMTAFRDQLTAQMQAQMQHLQQTIHTMHLNLPNLPQMPQMPTLANLPDYQSYLPTPMARRISNLVVNNRPESSDRPDAAKEQDYKWWDLFSGNQASAPPAYEDIFPQNESDLDVKRVSAERAVADTLADEKCTQIFDQTLETSTQAESSATATRRKAMVIDTVRIGRKHIITRELQDQLRLKHEELLKTRSEDRKLYLVWIPLLIVMILAMSYNRMPAAWSRPVTAAFESLMNRLPVQNPHQIQDRIVEVL
ncbi:SPT3 Dosage dependent suppressor of Ty-induced promoter mutations-like protein [Clarireedia jacksonii]